MANLDTISPKHNCKESAHFNTLKLICQFLDQIGQISFHRHVLYSAMTKCKQFLPSSSFLFILGPSLLLWCLHIFVRIFLYLRISAEDPLCNNVQIWIKCVTDGTSAQIMVTYYNLNQTNVLFPFVDVYSPGLHIIIITM